MEEISNTYLLFVSTIIISSKLHWEDLRIRTSLRFFQNDPARSCNKSPNSHYSWMGARKEAARISLTTSTLWSRCHSLHPSCSLRFCDENRTLNSEVSTDFGSFHSILLNSKRESFPFPTTMNEESVAAPHCESVGASAEGSNSKYNQAQVIIIARNVLW